MAKIYGEIDALTNINNESYLKRNYQTYISKYPDSKFIMFDFKDFKHFNDTYGHDIGDVYLKQFAEILKDNFKDSLVVRLHGDEFVILTNKSLEEIDKLFNLCDSRIKLSFDAGVIPEVFTYNAGIVNAEHGINNTANKADYMMYYAKQNNKRSQFFKDEIWNKKMLEDNFVKSINEGTENREFNYFSQALFTPDKNKTEFESICTRGKDCSIIFTPEKYDFLRNNSQLKKIDLFNLQYLLLRLNLDNNKVILSLDHKSLLSKPDLIEYLQLLVDVMNFKSNNLIISINVNDIDKKNQDKLINLINKMKELGFKVGIDRYNSKTGDTIYENSPIDYIKFDDAYWKSAIDNPKIDYSLKSKVNMFTDYINPSIPIFTCIEKEHEFIFAKNITKKPILLGGNYLEESKKMILKKD